MRRLFYRLLVRHVFNKKRNLNNFLFFVERGMLLFFYAILYIELSFIFSHNFSKACPKDPFFTHGPNIPNKVNNIVFEYPASRSCEPGTTALLFSAPRQVECTHGAAAGVTFDACRSTLIMRLMMYGDSDNNDNKTAEDVEAAPGTTTNFRFGNRGVLRNSRGVAQRR